ncbi:enoyl-CoA hydratase/isomerase family protein [Paraglaciecola sp.]|uniref:enoyl-CoA hydratase/isomerase family protein n=1 Tax=Paraglaciecola sp. TaxID=1920173 RepID=UPI003EF2ED2B
MVGVTYSYIQTIGQAKIACATLTKPKAFNALDIHMVASLKSTLKQWQDDPDIALVILEGDGDKAFCAGGDIVAMYHSMHEHNMPSQHKVSSPSDIHPLKEFFSLEYQLDYAIHTFSKPILVWGNGLVMGGGLGLMSGASHKVVTENARLAMPEISIGLYPDAGASFFLNKMPAGCGLFLGLTGKSINASEAIYANLANYFMPHKLKSNLLEKLKLTNWQKIDVAAKLSEICQELQDKHSEQLPINRLKENQVWLTELMNQDSVQKAEAYILAKSETDEWVNEAQANLQKGSSLSKALVFKQLHTAKGLSLAECLKMELILSCKCAEYGEFQEGVRALLIDKDYHPNWRFKAVDEVPNKVIKDFFSAKWSAQDHPLKLLQ